MTGVVVSTKMTKALTVAVYTAKTHRLYGKTYKSRKKYHVTCTDSSKFSVGQTVEIFPCRPISKTIRHRVQE